MDIERAAVEGLLGLGQHPPAGTLVGLILNYDALGSLVALAHSDGRQGVAEVGCLEICPRPAKCDAFNGSSKGSGLIFILLLFHTPSTCCVC